MEWLKGFAILIGRILLVLIFLNSGIGKVGNFEGTAQYMAKFGMSNTTLFLLGAIVFELLGSITVILGYFTRFGALLILIFLVPTTLIFHTNFADPMQMIQFMKNVSMFGGCLLLLSAGGGRFSLDYILGSKKEDFHISEDIIKLKKDLSEHELAVLNSEIEKQKKSIGLAYFLWFLFGSLGIHKFYIGNTKMGILYLILGIVGWIFLLSGIIFGEAALMGLGIIVALVFGIILGILLICDLFTIPRQIRKNYEEAERKTLAKVRS
jgi:putative oxidoreductase